MVGVGAHLGTLTVLVHSRGADPLALLLLANWKTDRKHMRLGRRGRTEEGREEGGEEVQVP